MAKAPNKPDLPESTIRIMERMVRTPPKPREATKDKQEQLKLRTRKPRPEK